jgi:hypothetical protein
MATNPGLEDETPLGFVSAAANARGARDVNVAGRDCGEHSTTLHSRSVVNCGRFAYLIGCR